MKNIKEAYLARYEKTLKKRVEGETSRTFEQVLVALIEGL
jgi:hypothetical protein